MNRDEDSAKPERGLLSVVIRLMNPKTQIKADLRSYGYILEDLSLIKNSLIYSIWTSQVYEPKMCGRQRKSASYGITPPALLSRFH